MRKATGGKNGRPRKKAAEKEKTGSLNKTREKGYAETEMKVIPMAEFPPAPGDLNEDGRHHWDIVVRELTKMRVLSVLDLCNLQAMCIEWQCYLAHRREQMEPGKTSYYAIKGDDGKVRSWQPHPVHFNGTAHLREYTRIANAFGLTPAARATIGVTTQESTSSKAAALLKKAV